MTPQVSETLFAFSFAVPFVFVIPWRALVHDLLRGREPWRAAVPAQQAVVPAK